MSYYGTSSTTSNNQGKEKQWTVSTATGVCEKCNGTEGLVWHARLNPAYDAFKCLVCKDITQVRRRDESYCHGQQIGIGWIGWVVGDAMQHN